MGLSGVATLAFNDLYKNDTTPQSAYGIGQLGIGPDGGMYRYASVGETALVMGNLLQESVADTQFIGMGIAAVASGDSSITVTLGTTTVEKGDFVGGTILVYTAGTVAIGDQYTIVDHTTGTSGQTIIVYLDRPARSAMSTSAKVSMFRNPWAEVIQAPTTQTGIPVGVALFAAAATTAGADQTVQDTYNYCWVKTHGVSAVLSDGSTFAVGSDVGTPSGTAGCVTVFAAGTTHNYVGRARQAAASAHSINVFLLID